MSHVPFDLKICQQAEKRLIGSSSDL